MRKSLSEAAAGRQIDLPCNAVDVVGARHGVERDFEIVGTARHRSNDRHVPIGVRAGQRLPLRGDQTPGRLEAEHPAEMRRNADRSADVAAGIDAGQTRRQRGCRAAG
jgi:hypothetical protein